MSQSRTLTESCRFLKEWWKLSASRSGRTARLCCTIFAYPNNRLSPSATALLQGGESEVPS